MTSARFIVVILALLIISACSNHASEKAQKIVPTIVPTVGNDLVGSIQEPVAYASPDSRYVIQNAFFGRLGGHETSVYAGGRIEQTQGNSRMVAFLLIYEYSRVLNLTERHEYVDPMAAAGTFTIVGVEGTVFTLQREDGSLAYFDLSSDAYK